MTRRRWNLGTICGIALAAGCSSPGPAPFVTPPPPLPPPESENDATGEGDVPPAPPTDADAEPDVDEAAVEPAVLAISTAPSSGPCGTWVELDEQLYRRTTFAFLTAEPERPGRVAVRAFLSDLYECGPCPSGFRCEPCGSRNVLRPYRGAPDEEAYIAFGSEGAGRCVDAYLRLGPGYRRYAGASGDSDPREKTVWLEAAAPIAESLCTAESFASEAAAAGEPEPCLAAFAPGAMVEREGELPLPTPGSLDLAERLRRAEVSFAAERWDEARTAYFRLARDAMRDEDLSFWGYAEWRTVRCDLALGDALPAIERLTSALGMPSRLTTTVPGLREALVADLGRACAAALQNAAEVESFLAQNLGGDELLAALEAAAEAWTAAGRATDARALRSIVERRRGEAGAT
jgi:hypothetical protein